MSATTHEDIFSSMNDPDLAQVEEEFTAIEVVHDEVQSSAILESGVQFHQERVGGGLRDLLLSDIATLAPHRPDKPSPSGVPTNLRREKKRDTPKVWRVFILSKWIQRFDLISVAK